MLRLGIERFDDELIVSWTPAWPGIVLEATENLIDPDWLPIPTGGTNQVALSMHDWHRFFRLNLTAIQGLCCPP